MRKEELNRKTVPELRALAKELGIVVKGRRKADILAGIMKAGKKALAGAARKASVKPEKPGKPERKVAAKKAALPAKKPAVRAARRATEKPSKPERPGKKIAGKKAPPAARVRAVSPEQSFRKKDLSQRTVAGLRALAKELGIVVRGRRKDDLIAEIQKAARRLRAKAPAIARKALKVPAKKAALPAARTEAEVPAKERLKPREPAKPRARVERPAAPAAAKPAAAKPAPPGEEPGVERPLARLREYHEIGAVTPSAPGMRKAPAESGIADRLAAIVVDPRQIFVSWQLREVALREGVPAIRVYDSTGVAFSARRARSFFDILLYATSGSAYVDVMPGRELFVALGVMGPGGAFSPVRTTGRLFVPRESAMEGRAILPEQYFRFRPPHY